MAHNRTQIRDALTALVKPALLTADLFLERRNRVDSDLMPLVILSLGEDAIDQGEASMGAPDVEHVQSATFECHVQASSGQVCAEGLDEMELQIEAALATDLTLGGLCEFITPIGSELEMDVSQDRVIAARAIVYAVTWRSEFGSPDTPEV